MVDVD
jgi:hypothetical protein